MAEIAEGSQEYISRLCCELAERESELELIKSIQLGLASHLEVQQIYDLVGDRVREIFNAQVVMISTYDPHTRLVEHRYAIERGQRVYSPHAVPPGGFRTRIIETGQPLLVNTDVARQAELLGQPTLPGTITPKSWLGVPMFVGPAVTGVLSLQNVDEENAFNEADVRLLQTLAASMSVALENARLWEQENLYLKALEREFEIGRRIQAGFLPATIPQPSGWEIAASLKPAREVAGDFYDVFPLPGQRIGLVIADVCDKGLGAALFMTLFRSLLRAVANIDFYARAGSAPAETPAGRLQKTISLTNNYIAETHGGTSMFATVFFGILNTHTGRLDYINGGHLPPLIIGSGGVKTAMPLTGPAVGALADAEYLIRQVTLEPGDVLFAYTDGLTDTENLAGQSFDEMRFVPDIGGEAPLAALLDMIQAENEAFSTGVKQFDDITMLAVRRKPVSVNTRLV